MLDIWTFKCRKCKKWKSHGHPVINKSGGSTKWICLDCLYKKKEVDNGERKESIRR